jgi:ABC-2 type transport system permease protein
MAALLAMTTFLTASSTGPVIIPLERRAHTYERLLAAPMSLITVLIGKSLVGIFFGVVVSLIPLVAAVLFFRVTVMYPLILLAAVALSSAAFSTLGVLFASGSAQSPGAVMMPSLLLRWPLLFLSGVFIPLNQMPSWLRLISNLSPLTYAQDLLNYAIVGKSADITQIFKPCGKIVDVVNIMSGGIQTPLVDVAMLVFLIVIFFIPAVRLQNRMRKLGA